MIQSQIAMLDNDDQSKQIELEQHSRELEFLKEDLANLIVKIVSLQEEMKETSTDELETVRKLGQRLPIAFHRLSKIFTILPGKAL